MKVLFCYQTVKNEAVIKALLEHRAPQYQTCAHSDLEKLSERQFDLIILDLFHVPNDANKLKSISACKHYHPSAPLLTLLDGTHDSLRFAALEQGADYCTIGAVNEKEIEIALKSLTREINSRQAEVISCGPLRMDNASRTVELDGQSVNLTPREYALLKSLIRKPKELVDTREMLSELKKNDDHLDLQRLQPHISRLRKKIMHPELAIKSVYGAGYKLDLAQ